MATTIPRTPEQYKAAEPSRPAIVPDVEYIASPTNRLEPELYKYLSIGNANTSETKEADKKNSSAANVVGVLFIVGLLVGAGYIAYKAYKGK